MTSPPLTHHAILELSEPFVRRGWRVDLAASDRIERRLVFRPTAPAGADATAVSLQLEDGERSAFRLTRTAQRPDAPVATLQAEGAHPDELLARIERVDPAQQFVVVDAVVFGLDQRVESAGADTSAPALLMARAHLAFDALSLTLTMPRVKGFPAEVEIRPAQGRGAELPDDLLAVLGWDWTRLVRHGDTWRGSLHLRGCGEALSRRGMAQLPLLARHLARTLAEPPARFHERQARARWIVAARSAVPLLTLALLIVAAIAVPYLEIEKDSVLRMLIFNSPPLLLALGVSLREIPRFELPRRPRPSRAAAWARPPDSSTV